jgi:hypothetical protein
VENREEKSWDGGRRGIGRGDNSPLRAVYSPARRRKERKRGWILFFHESYSSVKALSQLINQTRMPDRVLVRVHANTGNFLKLHSCRQIKQLGTKRGAVIHA